MEDRCAEGFQGVVVDPAYQEEFLKRVRLGKGCHFCGFRRMNRLVSNSQYVACSQCEKHAYGRERALLVLCCLQKISAFLIKLGLDGIFWNFRIQKVDCFEETYDVRVTPAFFWGGENALHPLESICSVLAINVDFHDAPRVERTEFRLFVKGGNLSEILCKQRVDAFRIADFLRV